MSAEITITGLDQLEKEIIKRTNKAMNGISSDFYRNIQLYSPIGTSELKKSWKLDNETGQNKHEIKVYSELPYATYQNTKRLRHPVPRDKIGTESFTSRAPSKAMDIRNYRKGYRLSILAGMYDTYEARYIEKAAEDAGLSLTKVSESNTDLEYAINADKQIQKEIDKI